MMLRMLEEEIGEMKFELHRETSIPINKLKKRGRRKYTAIYDLVEEFVSSDMDIASVDIPAHFDDRNKTLFEQAVRSAAKTNGVMANKRDSKMYLSKTKGGIVCTPSISSASRQSRKSR